MKTKKNLRIKKSNKGGSMLPPKRMLSPQKSRRVSLEKGFRVIDSYYKKWDIVKKYMKNQVNKKVISNLYKSMCIGKKLQPVLIYKYISESNFAEIEYVEKMYDIIQTEHQKKGYESLVKMSNELNEKIGSMESATNIKQLVTIQKQLLIILLRYHMLADKNIQLIKKTENPEIKKQITKLEKKSSEIYTQLRSFEPESEKMENIPKNKNKLDEMCILVQQFGEIVKKTLKYVFS